MINFFKKNGILFLIIAIAFMYSTFPYSAYAAITLINHAAAGGTANTVTTGAIDTTGANLIVIGVTFDTTAARTISDNKGNTWTPLTNTTSSSAGAQLYYAINPTVGSGHTFSNTGSSNFSSIFVEAFSGVATGGFDQQNGSTNSATTIQPGSVTPGQDNEVVVTFLGFNSAGTPVSINGGFTQSDTAINFSSGAHYGAGMAYLIQTTATAANPTWTRTNTQTNSTRIATFKASAPIINSALSTFTVNAPLIIRSQTIIK